jgi:hypothetical protein
LEGVQKWRAMRRLKQNLSIKEKMRVVGIAIE